MDTVGSYEAKTHLAALLERVARGEVILITKHGKPIAKLVPAGANVGSMSVEAAVAGLFEFRKKHPLKGVSLRELIDSGRKR